MKIFPKSAIYLYILHWFLHQLYGWGYWALAMPKPSIYVHIWTYINRATMYIVQMYIYIYMKGSSERVGGCK